MRVLIVEDEQLAANHLEKMILRHDSSIEVLAKLASVADVIDWFEHHQTPDLLFLDIHLEDDLSFAIFEKTKVTCPVIFTTAYDEYAIKAFKFKSIDYLLKPIVQEDLNQSIIKYKQWNLTSPVAFDASALLKLISQNELPYRERISVNIGQKIKSVEIADVAYFYSEEGLTFMVLNDKLCYPIDYSLDSISEELNPKIFFRINRQFLVRLKAIKNIHVFPKSRLKLELIPSSEKEIFVSIDKVSRFKEWLNT